jgi:hypothetical protein
LDAEKESGKEEESHHISGEKGIGNLEVGAEGGDEVGEDDSDRERAVVHNPEKDPTALESDSIKHKGCTTQADEGSNEELANHLVQKIRDDKVKAIVTLSDKEPTLQHESRGVGGSSKCRHHHKHEHHSTDVDEIVRVEVVTDIQVQSHDH